MIFLDQALKTRPSSSVLSSVSRFAKEGWYAFNAPYIFDKQILGEIDQGIATLYELVQAEEKDSLLVTQGERQNIALALDFVYKTKVYGEGRNFFAAPALESAPILEAMASYSPLGCEVTLLPVNEVGQLTGEILEKHLSPKTAILALSWVNPLTGVVQPIWELAEVCKKRGILFYVQGSEALQTLFFRFSDLPIDIFSFSGDKIHGPQGIGGVFCKGGLLGKKDLLRTPIPLLMGLSLAAKELIDVKDSAAMELAYLRNLFEQEVSKVCSEALFFGSKVNRAPHISCFAIPTLRQELLAFRLAKRGLFLSFGGGEYQSLEAILRACGLKNPLAQSFLSASFTLQTSEEEVVRASEILAEEVELSRRFHEYL